MMRFPTLFLLCALAIASPASFARDAANEADCRSGAYAMADGSRLIVSPSELPDLRYRFDDGRVGRLYRVAEGRYESGEGWAVRAPVALRAGFGDCAGGQVRIERDGAPALEGRRIVLPTAPIRFRSAGNLLHGELVMPADGVAPRAVVVLQYGGGRDSAVYNNWVQYLLAVHGIAAFVYDKPGTGRSEGEFNAHVGMLSDDLVAAVRAVRARPGLDGVPLGLMGESQGGWVAPLAATKTPVDFIVVSYGLAVSMLEEDRMEVAQGLRSRGWGSDVLAKGEALHDAVARVMVSRFDEGLDELAALKSAYRDEPWFGDIAGADLTGTLALAPDERMAALRELFDFPYDLAYDPLPVIAGVDAPQLWMFAGDDTEAPHASSLARLQALQVEGRPVDVVLFPGTDHGIIAVETGPDGRRLLGHHGDGYFRLLVGWILRQGLPADRAGTVR